MLHHTASALPISAEQQCGMFLLFHLIIMDMHFMIGGWGCCQHQHHIKLNCNQTQSRTHHLSSSDVEIITDIGMAQAKNSIGANVLS